MDIVVEDNCRVVVSVGIGDIAAGVYFAMVDCIDMVVLVLVGSVLNVPEPNSDGKEGTENS